MKSEQSLQSITLEDINTNTAINKHTGIDRFDGSSFIGIGLLLLFFIYMLHSGNSNSSNSSSSKTSTQNKKGIKLDNTEKKLADQVRALDMVIRNLYLKKRETEAEIRKVEMNSLSNLETDNTYDNDLKIDKLNMKIEEIEVMIDKKEEELEDKKAQLEQYQNETYL